MTTEIWLILCAALFGAMGGAMFRDRREQRRRSRLRADARRWCTRAVLAEAELAAKNAGCDCPPNPSFVRHEEHARMIAEPTPDLRRV